MGAEKYEHLATQGSCSTCTAGRRDPSSGSASSRPCATAASSSPSRAPTSTPSSQVSTSPSPARHAAVAVAASLLRAPERLASIQLDAYEFCKGSSRWPLGGTTGRARRGPARPRTRPGAGEAPRPARTAPVPVTPEPAPRARGSPSPRDGSLGSRAPCAPSWPARTHARSVGRRRGHRACTSVRRRSRAGRRHRLVADATTRASRRTIRGLACQGVALRVVVGTRPSGGDGLGVAHARVRNRLLGRVGAPYVLVIQPDQELFAGALVRCRAARP